MSDEIRPLLDSYPALAEDLRLVHAELRPAWERADRAALTCQKRFRGTECVLIAGSVLAVALGVLAAGGSEIVWLGASASSFSWVESGLTGALSALAFVAARLHLHGRWMRQRTIAETLRGEEFLVLARIGPYASSHGLVRLRERIAEIETQESGVDE